MITAAVKFTLSRIKKSKTATNTGEQSAATVVGKESIACGLGYKCKAKGAQGCWLVLAERKENGEILNVKAVKVDGKRILSDTFYQLNGGHFEVVND